MRLRRGIIQGRSAEPSTFRGAGGKLLASEVEQFRIRAHFVVRPMIILYGRATQTYANFTRDGSPMVCASSPIDLLCVQGFAEELGRPALLLSREAKARIHREISGASAIPPANVDLV